MENSTQNPVMHGNTTYSQRISEDRTAQKKPSITVTPILYILVVLLGGLSIFLGYKYVQLRSTIKTRYNDSEQTPSVTRPPSDTINLNPTILEESDSDWQLISSDVLGIAFSIPTSLTPDENNVGEVPGEIGFQYCLSYNGGLSLHLIPQVQAGGAPCDGGTLTLGAVTTDYEAGRGGGFGDLQRFQITEDGFVISKPPNQQFEISPTLVRKMVNQNNMNILVVTGADERTEMYPDGVPMMGTPGEGKIGAIVNLPNNSQYAGFTLQMKINKSDDRRIFDQILESIRPI